MSTISVDMALDGLKKALPNARSLYMRIDNAAVQRGIGGCADVALALTPAHIYVSSGWLDLTFASMGAILGAPTC